MYKILRSLLFLLPAERAHHFTTSMLNVLCRIPGIAAFIRSLYVVKDDRLAKTIAGIRFPNPVGLAAGFDKNAEYIHSFKNLGFGFLEIGTVTPKAQPGNEQPRLFRLKKDNALINRMGFNNEGADYAVAKLKRRPKGLLIGGNIGKNKITPNEEAESDYLICFRKLFPYVDYFVVNVSSPNTPNLRDLQEKEPLKKLLLLLAGENDKQPQQKPIFLKIAPDLTDSQLDDVLEIIKESGIAGIIATNTTISREGLDTPDDTLQNIGNGGLSGMPLSDRSTEVVRYLRQRNNEMAIIGVGGIDSVPSAIEKLDAGADLLQLYTGFVYKGPKLIKDINKALLNRFEER